ncbi:MAG: adenylate/guanylate cyclase domain-containing protein [Acidobacteriota bacterium]|nr:adenylate/guanylate cyclase domain-containing protein [Acidobacteriota bacterium]
MAVDWDAEGMLEGLSPREREGRVKLLDSLDAAGVSREELRRAIEEERLALLPVERAIVGEPRFTPAEAAGAAGVDERFLLALANALGLPTPSSEEVMYDEDDVAAVRAMDSFRKAGLPEGELMEVARMLGDSMAQVGEGIRRLVGEAMLHAGDTEQELGARYEHAATELLPLLEPLPAYVLNIQLRELIRRDVVGEQERASGHLAGTVHVSVAFADLVGFTSLGERLSVEELARMAGRLTVLGQDVAVPPVRFVKTIGDAVMLVSPRSGPLVSAALELVDTVEADPTLPSLRAGIASGPAINRWGDWYGAPVNIAHRVTERARPGSVLVTKEVRESAGDEFSWSRAGSHNFKNVSARISLHRARQPRAGARPPRAGPQSPDGATAGEPEEAGAR